MTFGHCGIDWLHSLLDSHSQILIPPAFSFYRSWKIIGADSARDAKGMFSLWWNYLEKHIGTQIKRRKLFYSKQEAERFHSRFYKFLESGGISRVNVFWAIHEAYARAKRIDVSRIKIVLAHEHHMFPFEQMLADFPQMKVLMIMRDPRAALAGSFHGMTKAFGYLKDYYFNFNVEIWMQAEDMWKKYRFQLGERLKIVKNEDLHADLEKSMRDIADWLGVNFSKSMLQSTFSGITWAGESSYIQEEEKYPEPLDIYYLPENVRSRWMNVLNHKEIVMIEFLSNDLMKEFGYERMVKDTLMSRIKGLVIYFLPHRGLFKRWLRLYPDLEEFDKVYHRLGNGVRGVIWKFLPNSIKFVSMVMHSIILRVRIYFFPGDRRQRYI